MNMIRLWAVALCVSLGLLAMPVAVADTSGKTALSAAEQAKVKDDLFAAFDKNGTPEEKVTFNKLPKHYQERVLNYYQIGKGEQTDTVKLLKGVYNLMYLYENIEIAKRAIAEYAQTSREPSEKSLGLMSFKKHINAGFPSAKNLIDWETITKIDDRINKVYVALIAKSKERLAKSKEELAKSKEELAKSKEELAKAEERRANLEKDIEIIKTLINAL